MHALNIQCGLQASSMDITGELIRNAESQASPGPAESESNFHKTPLVIHKHIYS